MRNNFLIEVRTPDEIGKVCCRIALQHREDVTIICTSFRLFLTSFLSIGGCIPFVLKDDDGNIVLDASEASDCPGVGEISGPFGKVYISVTEIEDEDDFVQIDVRGK